MRLIEDVELTIRETSEASNYFVIERKHHDGRKWEEKRDIGGGWLSTRHMTSARLSPEADVEGYDYEMLEIARAIKADKSVSFKRCAVAPIKGGFLNLAVIGFEFESPRNSEKTAAFAKQRCLELADLITEELEVVP